MPGEPLKSSHSYKTHLGISRDLTRNLPQDGWSSLGAAPWTDSQHFWWRWRVARFPFLTFLGGVQLVQWYTYRNTLLEKNRPPKEKAFLEVSRVKWSRFNWFQRKHTQTPRCKEPFWVFFWSPSNSCQNLSLSCWMQGWNLLNLKLY